MIPYLIVENAGKLIEFIAIVFDADILNCSTDDSQKIKIAMLKIGDSVIEVTDSNKKYLPKSAALHVYVPDVDIVFGRALDAGAISIFPPANREVGERICGINDPFGNSWFISSALIQGLIPDYGK